MCDAFDFGMKTEKCACMKTLKRLVKVHIIPTLILCDCGGAKCMFSIAAECSRCGETFPHDKVLTVCPECSGALLFRYDLAKVADRVSRSVLEKREDTFWKFIELLPLSSSEIIVSLGEPYTPAFRLSKGCGTTLNNVYIKDDGRLPTGTFKARGMAVAVSKLKELGVKRVRYPQLGTLLRRWLLTEERLEWKFTLLCQKTCPEATLKNVCLWALKCILLTG